MFAACAGKSFGPVSLQNNGCKTNVLRDFCKALDYLNRNYFKNDSNYSKKTMQTLLPCAFRFWKIINALSVCGIFMPRMGALQKKSTNLRMRIKVALRMLGYGNDAEAFEKYLQMSNNSVLFSTRRFREKVIKVFGEEYLRFPTKENTYRIFCVHMTLFICIFLLYRFSALEVEELHWAWEGSVRRSKKQKPVLEKVINCKLPI